MAARHQQQQDTGNRPRSTSRAVSAWPSRWLTATNGRPRRQRDRLGRHHPDDDAADEAGPAGRRHRRRDRRTRSRRGERAGDHPVEMIEMGARRDLRHHAAIGSMLRQLRQDDIGADARFGVAHHRRRGLVAARLDAQHQHWKTFSTAHATFGLRQPSHDSHTRPHHRHPRLSRWRWPQTDEVRDRLAAAPGPGWRLPAPSPWRSSRSAPPAICAGPAAGRDRRQGPVHQGTRRARCSPAASTLPSIP